MIPSPFNFVPLSDRIVHPAWGPDASHDRPFEDGVSGWFDVDVTIRTPLIVCGPDSKPSDKKANRSRQAVQYTLPDGRPALPGTTVRGALRAVVEIASFSGMRFVTDRRFGLRDLTNAGKAYQEDMRRSEAGWLVADDDGWRIEPVPFWRITYGDLARFADCDPNSLQRGSLASRYGALGDAQRAVWLAPARAGRWCPARGAVEHRQVQDLSRTARPKSLEARVVLTGGIHGKKAEFVFAVGGGEPPLPVSREVRLDFEFIHSDGAEQHKLEGFTPNETWKYWRGRLKSEGRVPVFFIRDGAGEVATFGLAYMFRMAYRHSPRDLVRRRQGGWSSGRYDFAELVFGSVRESEDGFLRGRVSVETAPIRGQEGQDWSRGERARGVLSSPKPTFLPSYVRQRVDRRQPGRLAGALTSYLDDDAELRGWKRYQQREAVVPLPPFPADGEGGSQEHLGVSFEPLGSGRFRARVHVHNVRPEELGGLIWALDFGGKEQLRHGIGMARPAGYGGCTMALAEGEGVGWLRSSLGEVLEDDKVHERCAGARKKFVAWMSEQVPGWADCAQVEALRMLAAPAPPEADNALRYPVLMTRPRINEFSDAKRAGKGSVLEEPASIEVLKARAERISPDPRPAPGAPPRGRPGGGRRPRDGGGPAVRRGPGGAGAGRKLFVGGLPWGVDDEGLRREFEQHGRVTEAKVILDRDTGRSRGFGFVTFETEEQARSALAMDGASIDGRQVRVNVAEDRRRRR